MRARMPRGHALRVDAGEQVAIALVQPAADVDGEAAHVLHGDLAALEMMHSFFAETSFRSTR